jgi:hypothetical protein
LVVNPQKQNSKDPKTKKSSKFALSSPYWPENLSITNKPEHLRQNRSCRFTRRNLLDLNQLKKTRLAREKIAGLSILESIL